MTKILKTTEKSEGGCKEKVMGDDTLFGVCMKGLSLNSCTVVASGVLPMRIV